MDTFSKVLRFYVILTKFKVFVWAGDSLRCTTDRTYNGMYYEYTNIYCLSGCCGSFPYGYCCSDGSRSDDESTDDDSSATIGIIIGSIIGTILLLSCIVTFICCVVKKKNRSGTVVQPKQGVDIATNTENVHPEFCQLPSWYQPTTGRQLSDEFSYTSSNQPLPAVDIPKRQHIDPT